MKNQFEELCKLASNENWCWKIACSTCGHLHFRYAYHQIGKGIIVGSSDWIITESKTSYDDELGSPPKQFEQEVRKYFLNECKDSSLGRISQECKFPDWLGYLGLVIHHFKHDQHFQSLSKSWSEQLSKMVQSDLPIHSRLFELSTSDLDVLSINELEKIQHGIR